MHRLVVGTSAIDNANFGKPSDTCCEELWLSPLLLIRTWSSVPLTSQVSHIKIAILSLFFGSDHRQIWRMISYPIMLHPSPTAASFKSVWCQNHPQHLHVIYKSKVTLLPWLLLKKDGPIVSLWQPILSLLVNEVVLVFKLRVFPAPILIIVHVFVLHDMKIGLVCI